MKFYQILLICCAIYYVEASYCTGDRLKFILAKCMADEEATEDDIEDILLQKKAASENAKCFRACVLQECNLMDATGNLDISDISQYYPLLSHGDAEQEKFIDVLLQKCLDSTKVEGNVCTTAEYFYDCVYEECKDCGWELHSFLK